MRCFIALPLPSEAREALARALEPLRARWPRLRWTAPEGYHLTLAFLGEIEGQSLDRARAAVQGLPALPGFAFSFSRLSYLPPRPSPRVLVAELAEVPAGSSASLSTLVEEALGPGTSRPGGPGPNGDCPPARPFRPHLTLARLGPGSPAPDLASLAGLLPAGEWTIGRCALYKSDLRPSGAVYTELVEIPLL